MNNNPQTEPSPIEVQDDDFRFRFLKGIEEELQNAGLTDGSNLDQSLVLTEFFPGLMHYLEQFEFEVRKDTLAHAIILQSPEVVLDPTKREALAWILTGTTLELSMAGRCVSESEAASRLAES